MRADKRGMLALLLLLFGCGICFSACAEQSGKSDGKATEITEENDDLADKDDEEDGDIYVITAFDSEQEEITIKSITSQRKFRYSYSLGTRFLNKYDTNRSMTDFGQGTVVTIGKARDGILSYVKMYDGAWTVDELTNFSVDVEKEQLVIGQTKYRLRDTAEIFSADLEATASDIRETDVLRVVGIDKEVLSVVVTTGHGYISVINTATFDDSLMSVGTKIFTMLHGNTTIEVTEGEYDLTVAKDGYGGTAKVVVGRNETVTVDLDTLKGEGPKVCAITFHVEAANAHIFLDGNEVAADAPVEVAYGEHTLKIVAEGYETWEKTLFVNSPSAEISLELSDEDTDEESTTANSSSNTSESSNSGNTESNTGDSAGSRSSASDSKDKDTDAELDYLTTLSNMISTLTGN